MLMEIDVIELVTYCKFYTSYISKIKMNQYLSSY
jgi:hypothetical protein